MCFFFKGASTKNLNSYVFNVEENTGGFTAVLRLRIFHCACGDICKIYFSFLSSKNQLIVGEEPFRLTLCRTPTPPVMPE